MLYCLYYEKEDLWHESGFPVFGGGGAGGGWGGPPPQPAKILTNLPSLKFCPSPLMSPST